MIYEAKVTGRFNGEYWVTIPVKFGRQSFGPIRAVPGIDPGLDEFVYVGQVPAAETFVILSGTPIPTATITWGNITGKPTTFTPATHTHTAAQTTSGTFSPDRLPAATSAAQGALSAADKAKLDAAASLPTAGTLAMRDAAGNLRVGTAASGSDATNKTYVDAQVATRAPSSHTHLWAQITDKPTTFAPSAHTHAWADVTGAPATYAPSAHSHAAADVSSGVLAAARLPAATTAAQGAMSAADKALLDGATPSPTANTLVKNDANGRFQVATPSAAADVAPKSYVDAQVATRSLTTHTHAWADITSKPTTFAPSAHVHSGADITTGTISDLRIANATASLDGLLPKADKAKLDTATWDYGPNDLMMTDSSGNVRGSNFYTNVAQSSLTNSLTRKDYVDAGLAARALLSHSHEWADLPAMVELGNAVDFNTLTTRNRYHQSANAEAATATNSPSSAAGYLEVESLGSFVYQWYYEYGPGRKVFYRTKYGSTWYAWREVAFADYVDAPPVWTIVPLTNTTNFSVYEAYSYMRIEKSNGRVTFQGALRQKIAGIVDPAATGAANTVGVIPSEFLPAPQTQTLNWRCQSSVSNSFHLGVEADGRVLMNRYGPGNSNVDAWLPFNVSWRA